MRLTFIVVRGVLKCDCTLMGVIDKNNKTSNLHITLHWGVFVQPSLQWRSNKYYIFWVCVCRLTYPACNEREPYCHLWPDRLDNIFRNYLTNGTTFEKKKLRYSTQNMCFNFVCHFVRDVSHSKKNWKRHYHKCILVSTDSTRFSCQILMKLEFCR